MKLACGSHMQIWMVLLFLPWFILANRKLQDCLIGTDLIILAGKDYGCGSSRDWAAKGPFLLGIKVWVLSL